MSAIKELMEQELTGTVEPQTQEFSAMMVEIRAYTLAIQSCTTLEELAEVEVKYAHLTKRNIEMAGL